VNLEEAKLKLEKAAGQLLIKNECAWEAGITKNDGAWISFRLPESRQDLLTLLINDEARGFVDHMVGHFDTLAMFIPVVDEIVSQHAGKGK
jgi:hypothetical protein